MNRRFFFRALAGAAPISAIPAQPAFEGSILNRPGAIVDQNEGLQWAGDQPQSIAPADVVLEDGTELPQMASERLDLFAFYQGVQWDPLILRERLAHRRPTLVINRLPNLYAASRAKARRRLTRVEEHLVMLKITRRNMDAQRFYNYMASALAERERQPRFDPPTAWAAMPRRSASVVPPLSFTDIRGTSRCTPRVSIQTAHSTTCPFASPACRCNWPIRWLSREFRRRKQSARLRQSADDQMPNEIATPLFDVIKRLSQSQVQGPASRIKQRYVEATDATVVLADCSGSMVDAIGSSGLSKCEHLAIALADVHKYNPKIRIFAFASVVRELKKLTDLPDPRIGYPLGGGTDLAKALASISHLRPLPLRICREPP